MYTIKNYASKAEIKRDIANGVEVRIYQPNDIFGNPKAASDYTGTAGIEGPHYPKPHRWYATATLENGKVIKIA